MLLADIIVDEAVFFEEQDGPNMVIGIVKRFMEERPDKTEFKAIWLFAFVREFIWYEFSMRHKYNFSF